MAIIKAVPGFRPSTSGFHFSNSFPNVPLLTIDVLGQQIPIGDAANGLCGGMVYAARDFFEAGIPIWPDTVPPSSGPLYDHLVKRLFDSFDLVLPPPPLPPAPPPFPPFTPPFSTPIPPFGPGPATYMWLMNPNLPDHETVASQTLFAPRGRAWVMINEQWPKIMADIDNGKLSPMALIGIKSVDPFDMKHDHQVLAYGYRLDGYDLDIYVYDPNIPNDDKVTISLNIANPEQTTPITFSAGDPVFCFFRPEYTFAAPPEPPRSRCFIATAAYGSPLAPEVDLLRSFRDNVIRKTRSGAETYERFYDQYYRLSPPIADLMRQDEKLRNVVEWSLVTPIVNYYQLALLFPTTNVDKDIEEMQEPFKSFLIELREGLENWASSFEMPYDFTNLPVMDAAEEIRIVLSYILRREETRNSYLNRLMELNQIPLKTTPDERKIITEKLYSSGRSSIEIGMILGAGIP